MHLFKTVKDPVLQQQLLKHLPPATPRIALFRCRLALAFFFRDHSPLDRPTQHLFNLKQIAARLSEDERFGTKGHISRSQKIDFAELAATTYVLDIAIDAGRANDTFPDKATENSFNKEVDLLADQIKSIFTSIQDTGATYLKRTEAKETLQALYYRLFFGVRTKPRPVKSWFSSDPKKLSKDRNQQSIDASVVKSQP